LTGSKTNEQLYFQEQIKSSQMRRLDVSDKLSD